MCRSVSPVQPGRAVQDRPLPAAHYLLVGTADSNERARAPVLLLVPDSPLRKQLRDRLTRSALGVVTATSLAEALSRVRVRHHPLVVCVGHRAEANLEEEYAILIDRVGLLSRTAGVALYLPGVGIRAHVVLLLSLRACDDLVANVQKALDRLNHLHADRISRSR